MSRQAMWWLSLALIVGLVSAGYGQVLTLGDFEGGLDGWAEGDATLSAGATGATVGGQALQVDGPGGWHIDALLDMRPNLAALANQGATITADITAIDTDMTTTWMQVEMVINAQNNDDNGANNNIGWNGLGLQDIAMDGEPHTYTWALPDDLVAMIAGADDNIGWFELALVSNNDSASVTKFYIDNIQLSYPEPTSSVVIGDFENDSLDNWGPGWEDNTAVEVSTVGTTSGSGSLAVTKTEGYWGIQWNAPSVPETLAETRLQFDLTMIASEWPVGHWTQVANSVALNSNGTSGWKEFTEVTAVDTLTGADTSRDWGRWTEDAPDVVKTYTVDISDYDLTDATWFQIIITIQGGDGQGHFYFDNIKLVGPAEEETPKSTDIVIANWEQEMDGWVVGGGADVLFNDTNGVTLDDYSLDIWIPNGEWNTDVLVLNLLDPNNADIMDVFKMSTEISVDVTRLVADWPADDIPGWNEILMVINCGGDGWSLWQLLGKEVSWNQNNGDSTDTATWDYAPYLDQIDFDNITWCELHLGINANDPEYEGWVWFYLDNMRLSGAGIPLTPTPADGAENVSVETMLEWTPGLFAGTHELYFGTEAVKVAGAEGDSDADVLFTTLDTSSFDPNGLAFDTRYFWRVVEVNDANPDSPWDGPVWSFTTANYIIVEDFERYGNDAAAMEQVYQTWIDGLGYIDPAPGVEGNGTGSVLGYDPAFGDIMETTTVYGGSQSVSLAYNNAESPFVSDIIRTFDEPKDWTVQGFDTLRLSVYGQAINTADQLYVILEDADGKAGTVAVGTPEVLTTLEWTTLDTPLADFTAQGVNVAAVAKMTVRVGSPTNSLKGSGSIFLDDIQVCYTPVGLVAHYAFEDNLQDSSGNGHDGVLAGDPNFPVSYVTGSAGSALQFDGTDGHEYVDLGTFNPSAATNQLSLALWVKWDGPSGSWQGLMGKRNSGDWDSAIMMWYLELERDVWDIRFAQPGTSVNTGHMLQESQWTHVAVTYDGTTATVYADGEVIGEGDFSFGEDKEAPMQIGCAASGGGNPFNGTLDEVRIYDRVLSEEEILELAGN